MQLRDEVTPFRATVSFVLPLFLFCFAAMSGVSSAEAATPDDNNRRKNRHGKHGSGDPIHPPDGRPWDWVLPQNNGAAAADSCHLRRSSFASGKYLPDEVAQTLVVETPMVGIELDTFMKLGHIPISTTAKAKGLLTTFDPEKHVAFFISHTWWMRPMHATGYDQGAPDYVEDGHPKQHLKYRIICRAIMQLIMSGQLDLEGKTIFLWFGMPLRLCPPIETSAPHSKCTPTDQCPCCDCSDWFSIDQDDPIIKLQGVRSLIAYATMCAVMLIPTEEASLRSYLFATPKDLPWYGTRGWTRVECTPLPHPISLPNERD